MIRNSATAPNTAPNEIVKSPIRMPNEKLLIASSRSPAATSQRPIASAMTISTNSARTMPEASLAEQAEAARIDPELARELSPARGIGRHGPVDRCVGDDQQQIERRDQREREHDAARGERRKARIAGEQRAHDARDDDPGEQPHAGDAPRLLLDIALAHQQMNQQRPQSTSANSMRSAVSTASGAPIVRCSARRIDERAEQPAAPDQMRGQPLRARVVELDLPAARIVGRKHAGRGRARERRDRGTEDQARDQALVAAGMSSNWSSSCSTTKTAIGAVSARRRNTASEASAMP